MLRVKLTALNAYVRKRKGLRKGLGNNLSFHVVKLEKNEMQSNQENRN